MATLKGAIMIIKEMKERNKGEERGGLYSLREDRFLGDFFVMSLRFLGDFAAKSRQFLGNLSAISKQYLGNFSANFLAIPRRFLGEDLLPSLVITFWFCFAREVAR